MPPALLRNEYPICLTQIMLERLKRLGSFDKVFLNDLRMMRRPRLNPALERVRARQDPLHTNTSEGETS